MCVRGVQGGARVHRRLHLPLDAEQGEQPAAQRGALPQADRRLGLEPRTLPTLFIYKLVF